MFTNIKIKYIYIYIMNNENYKEWEISNQDIVINKNELIGEGSFAKVYMCNWRKTKVVAKVINNIVDEDDKKLIKRELDMLIKIKHPNIVQFLGYVGNPFIIVTEYISNGDLLKYITNNKFNLKKKIDICLDILEALIYLHNRKPNNIIHRDIKPQNILITSTIKAKLVDFGLSRLFNNFDNKNRINDDKLNYLPNDLTNKVGSKRYMAPELNNSNIYDFKIDIWSCGIVFMELFENRRYYKPFKLTKTPLKVIKIIKSYMININPKERLNATEIYNLFNEINIKNKCCI